MQFQKILKQGRGVLFIVGCLGLVHFAMPELISRQAEAALLEVCDNGFDDDQDFLVDCKDPDCAKDPACQVCPDSDKDGTDDCQDPCPFDPTNTCSNPKDSGSGSFGVEGGAITALSGAFVFTFPTGFFSQTTFITWQVGIDGLVDPPKEVDVVYSVYFNTTYEPADPGVQYNAVINYTVTANQTLSPPQMYYAGPTAIWTSVPTIATEKSGDGDKVLEVGEIWVFTADLPALGPIVLGIPPCSADADCEDGNLCTQDSCNAGTCERAATSCEDDGVACTVELCDAVEGCISEPNHDLCSYLGRHGKCQPSTKGADENGCKRVPGGGRK